MKISIIASRIDGEGTGVITLLVDGVEIKVQVTDGVSEVDEV